MVIVFIHTTAEPSVHYATKYTDSDSLSSVTALIHCTKCHALRICRTSGILLMPVNMAESFVEFKFH